MGRKGDWQGSGARVSSPWNCHIPLRKSEDIQIKLCFSHHWGVFSFRGGGENMLYLMVVSSSPHT